MNRDPHRRSPTRRILLAASVAVAFCAAASSAAGSAPAATVCVGTGSGCFSTVQAAVNAARDGDTIEIGPGTFAGGIEIDKSVQLSGTSAATTIIEGGGPVITIGQFEGDNDLTAGLSRLTIRGGFNDSKPFTAVVAGGGVWIPQSSGDTTGATVSIDDSVISGNQVTARTTIPSGGFSCSAAHAHPCAFVGGGGINNSGVLTLTNTRVTGNVSGATPAGSSLASYAFGGGIVNNNQGTLTLRRSFITGNRAAVVAPNGAFTDGGGISDGGVLRIEASVVGSNTSAVSASVPSVFPSDVQVEANAGGIYLNETSTATITDSTIGDNGVDSINTAGDANSEAGGLDVDGSLVLQHSNVTRNQVRASTPPGSGSAALAIDGGLQVQGSLIMRDGRVSQNSVLAVTADGAALAAAGGIESNMGQTTLERTLVVNNRVSADGPFGVAQGGGVSNFLIDPDNPPHLTLVESVITANSVEASPGIAPEGGGLWSNAPLTLTRTLIAGNRPDQCVGC